LKLAIAHSLPFILRQLSSEKENLAVIRPLCLAACLLVSLPCLAPLAAQENNRPPAGFTALFNGRDLSGWFGLGHFDPRKWQEMSDDERQQMREANQKDLESHWRVEDGVVINDGQGAYLSSEKNFGDMELWIDFKIVPKGDSGIYLRGTPQVQIWDFTEEGGYWRLGADKGSGGLWNNSAGAAGKDPLVLADNPIGDWNRFHILQVGDRTTVWLNDKLIVDRAPLENYFDRARPLYASGPIQLQTHGGEIQWRNIFVREIAAEEANTLLRGGDDQALGFTSIFNGQDLEGWAGATENYEVRNGAVVCKPGKGGTLYTKEQYDDFVARLEFKLPPGGNNGLAIRYPGEGDPAYTGMCELQVLDSEHPKYQNLDPRQTHGSAYGMVAAHRGYLRPAGEWNYQQVTIKGSTIKVELNGYTILNADLADVTDFLGNRPHPGKDLKTGYFGFAGHSDPVEFRKVSVKRLK
jgi:hypothetical protein